MIKALIVFGILSFSFQVREPAVKGQVAPRVGQSDMPNVSLCELLQNPKIYDKKFVRLKAIYAVNFESVLLYDCNCNGNNYYLYPFIKGETDEKSKAIKDKIDTNLSFSRGTDRVGLILKGTFLAPHPNPSIREVGNEWPRFQIIEVEKVFNVDKGVPPPTGGKIRKHRKISGG